MRETMMALVPVSEPDRVRCLDVVRGFAVLGILAVNAGFFAAPWQASVNPAMAPLAIDDQTLWSWLFMHVFFEFKFITLFSMLFGVSIFLVGGERCDAERSALLRRRLTWLLAFGVAHAILIWDGDVLVIYALTGFFVMLVRSWPAPALAGVGGALYLLMLGLQIAYGAEYQAMAAAQIADVEAKYWSLPPREIERVIAAYQGGLASATLENARTWISFMVGGLPGLMVRTAGVMMIGLALFKWGFLSGKGPVWLYLVFIALGVGAFAIICQQALVNYRGGFDFVAMQAGGLLANNALSIFGSLAYASGLILLCKAGFALVTGPLAAVGRMAFTNYIAQSLIMTTIFWGGRGFGFFGEVDRPTLWAIVAAVWLLQLIWSPLWLSHFQMGPLEWLWRRLSYGRPFALARGA